MAPLAVKVLWLFLEVFSQKGPSPPHCEGV
jgi:hypothetical protein